MKDHRFHASLGALAGVAALLVGSGCVADRSTDEQAPEPQAAAQAQADGEAHRHHHCRGPTGVVIDTTLEHGELSAEQRARVELIDEELRERRADRGEAHQRMRTSAANIVRAGSADPERFERSVDEMLATIERRMDASAGAVIEVHGVLNERQRSLVADRLQQRLDERRERHQRRHERRDGKLKELAARLALTASQVDQLKAMGDKIKKELAGDRERIKPTHEEIEAIIDAFRTERFAKKLHGFQNERLERLRGRVTRVGEHTDTALTLLTQNQRYLLADVIELGPEAVGLGGGDEEPRDRH